MFICKTRCTKDHAAQHNPGAMGQKGKPRIGGAFCFADLCGYRIPVKQYLSLLPSNSQKVPPWNCIPGWVACGTRPKVPAVLATAVVMAPLQAVENAAGAPFRRALKVVPRIT